MERPQDQDQRCPHAVRGQVDRRSSCRADRAEAGAEGRPQRRGPCLLTTKPSDAQSIRRFLFAVEATMRLKSDDPFLASPRSTSDANSATVTDCVPLKPQTYNGDITKLPPALAHLRAEKVWLCWRWFWNGKKWTKPPRRVDDPSRNASTIDPTTWGTYEQAVAQVRDGGADGIGFALKDRNIGGVDLDHCRDPVTCQIEAWADDYIRRFPGAYVEATVSGKGLRILGTSALES